MSCGYVMVCSLTCILSCSAFQVSRDLRNRMSHQHLPQARNHSWRKLSNQYRQGRDILVDRPNDDSSAASELSICIHSRSNMISWSLHELVYNDACPPAMKKRPSCSPYCCLSHILSGSKPLDDHSNQHHTNHTPSNMKWRLCSYGHRHPSIRRLCGNAVCLHGDKAEYDCTRVHNNFHFFEACIFHQHAQIKG